MTGTSDENRVQVSRSELSLYEHLLNELGGGYGHEVRTALGRQSDEVYEYIRERARDRLRGPIVETYELDAIDLAVIRALAPIILWRFDEREFKTITNHSFDEVRALRDRADNVHVRVTYSYHHIEYRRDGPRIRLPLIDVPQNQLLLLVPDAASWGGLWDSWEDPPDREAVLAEVSRWGQRRWPSRLEMEARSVSDLDELEVEALQRRIAKRRVRREKRRSSLLAKRSSAPPSSLELAQARRLWRGWRRRPPPQGWDGFETYANLLTQVFRRDKTEPLHRWRRDMLIDFMPALDRQIESSAGETRPFFLDLRDLVVFAINFEGP